MKLLTELGVDYGQGYHLGRPRTCPRVRRAWHDGRRVVTSPWPRASSRRRTARRRGRSRPRRAASRSCVPLPAPSARSTARTSRRCTSRCSRSPRRRPTRWCTPSSTGSRAGWACAARPRKASWSSRCTTTAAGCSRARTPPASAWACPPWARSPPGWTCAAARGARAPRCAWSSARPGSRGTASSRETRPKAGCWWPRARSRAPPPGRRRASSGSATSCSGRSRTWPASTWPSTGASGAWPPPCPGTTSSVHDCRAPRHPCRRGRRRGRRCGAADRSSWSTTRACRAPRPGPGTCSAWAGGSRSPLVDASGDVLACWGMGGRGARPVPDAATLALMAEAGARAAGGLANANVLNGMQATRRRLEQVLAALGEAVSVTDPEGRFAYANEAAARLFGANSPAELLTRPSGSWLERFTATDEHGRPLSPDELPSRKLHRGEPAAPLLTRSVERATGRTQWLRTTSRRLDDPDGPLVVNIVEDVTQAVQGEHRRQTAFDVGVLLDATGAGTDVLQRVAERLAPGWPTGAPSTCSIPPARCAGWPWPTPTGAARALGAPGGGVAGVGGLAQARGARQRRAARRHPHHPRGAAGPRPGPCPPRAPAGDRPPRDGGRGAARRGPRRRAAHPVPRRLEGRSSPRRPWTALRTGPPDRMAVALAPDHWAHRRGPV